MTSKLRNSLLLCAPLVLAGCGTVSPNKALPSGMEAYEVVPEVVKGYNPGAIQPGDRLSIRVLGEPDLSSDQYWVDGSGHVQVPLAGELDAGGRSAEELRDDIRVRLAERFIRDPQISIGIAEHAKFGVSVEGEVQKAGRFEVSPGLTLLGAIALAGSTTKDTKLDEIYIFRDINGKKAGARFNIGYIRNGKNPDPQIIPGDVIVVGRSAIRGTWHEFLQASPLFNVYYYLK
jgi:polysaccharide export outer membrane protein